MIFIDFKGYTIRVALDANTLWFCAEDLKKVLPKEWFFYNKNSNQVCNKLGLEWLNEELTRSIADVIDTAVAQHDKTILGRLTRRYYILRRFKSPNIGAELQEWIRDKVIQSAIRKVHIYAFNESCKNWTTSMIISKAFGIHHKDVIRRIEEVYCISQEGSLHPYNFVNDFGEVEKAYKIDLTLFKAFTTIIEHKDFSNADKRFDKQAIKDAFYEHFKKLIDLSK